MTPTKEAAIVGAARSTEERQAAAVVTCQQANAPAVVATEGVQSPLAGARRSAYGLSAVMSADGCMLGRSSVETSW
jgi:hypothetical protein